MPIARLLLLCVLLWLAGPCHGLAQGLPYPAAISASYTVNMITAAPGQLITLIVEGINTSNLYHPFEHQPARTCPIH